MQAIQTSMNLRVEGLLDFRRFKQWLNTFRLSDTPQHTTSQATTGMA